MPNKKPRMEEPMSDSECSDSSENDSSEASSSGSESDQSSQSLEPARILKQTIELPKNLCEDRETFNDFFSLDTWNSLPDHMKAQLRTFLPQFNGITSTDKQEQNEVNITIQKLFTNQITRFGITPLSTFQKNLEDGNYRPDIARLRANIRKSQRREQRFQQCERISRLAKDLVVSREKLLRTAYDGTTSGSMPEQSRKVPKLASTAAAERARKRYFEELATVMDDVGLEDPFSDDENYPEGPPVSLMRKQKKLSSGNQGGTNSAGSEQRIISTMSMNGAINQASYNPNAPTNVTEDEYRKLIVQHRKRKIDEGDHPELDIDDIKFGDVYVRTQNAVGRRPASFTKQLILSKMPSSQSPIKVDSDAIKLESGIPTESPAFDIPSLHASQHLNLNQPLIEEIKSEDNEIKLEPKSEPNVSSDPIPSNETKPQSTSGKKRTNVSAIGGKESSKKPLISPSNSSNTNNSLLTSNNVPIKTEANVVKIEKTVESPTPTVSNTVNITNYAGKQVKAATLSDLEGIDMMHLPVDLDDSGNIDLLSEIVDMKPTIVQETHACFLSLIRDIFCATPEHRMSLDNLRSSISTWITNPITTLNDWFNLADSWLDLLTSAIHFLAGEFVDQPEDFVPYAEYKTNLQLYQWIGAGRDSDQHLRPLCEYWLKRRDDMGTKPTKSESNRNKQISIDLEDSLSSGGNLSSTVERSQSPPPPPRCPTTWTVRKATTDEIVEFREQERRRFENPHLSFTYRMHGYESVVGPVKGIYTQIPALTKARGHPLLVDDRPNYVTILTLVRDSTARLPNGEGTRTDICELLKSSQYVSPTASETVLQTIVSGALDRMHTEHDPCVRYDGKRKIWIYLHRNRSADEFERMHQQFQGVTKHKKQTIRKTKSGKTTISPSDEMPSTIVVSTNASPKKTIIVTPTISQQQPQPIMATIVSSISPQTKPMTAQKKTEFKPELVPIKMKSTTDSMDPESSKIGSKPPTPIIIQQSKTLTIDRSPKQSAGTKIIGKPTINLLPSNSTQIKVSTPCGIQTVHVSAATGQTLVKPPLSSILTSTSNASVLVANQSPTLGRKIQATKITATPPPLIAQTTPTVSSYMIPLSIGKTTTLKSASPIVTSAITKTVKATYPTLANANMPRMSLLQPTQTVNVNLSNKTLIRNATTIPAGKSLINPTVSGNMQQVSVVASPSSTPNTSNMQIIQAKPMQQKFIVASSASATGKSTLGTATSQTSAPLVVQKIIAVSKPMSSITTSTVSSSAQGVTPPGTSLINPHIIQIHQGQQKLQPTKMTTVSTSNLTPTQTQTLLHSIKQQQQQQQQIRMPSSSTAGQTVQFTKQQQVIQQIQKQLQQSQQSTQLQLTSPTKIQLTTNPTSSMQSPIVRTIKAGTSLIQSNATTANVRNISGNNSLVGKVLTDASGQIISLESLLQKQNVNATSPTLRLTGVKTSGQGTNLIQLATSNSGSQITQYAVVTQGRSLISMSQPRLITSQATSTNVTTLAGSTGTNVVTVGGVKATINQPKTELMKIGTRTINPQQLINAKVLGVQSQPAVPRVKGGTSIRMVNASNLNIAQIGGKSVIIASKTPTLLNQTSSVVSQSNSLSNANRTNVIWTQNVSGGTTTGTNSFVLGGQTVKVQGNITSIPFDQSSNSQVTTAQNVMFGNQIVKLQTTQKSTPGISVLNTNVSGASTAATSSARTVVLSSTGQTIKVHTPSQAMNNVTLTGKTTVTGGNMQTAQPIVLGSTNVKNVIKGTNLTTTSPGQRVVLAVQGGGQILLPQNFQGNAINLKSLQGLKMIPVQQSQSSQIQQNQIVTNVQTSRANATNTKDK